MPAIPGRRSFMSLFGALTAAAATGGGATLDAQAPPRSNEFDVAWLERLSGAHKQAFDYGSFNLSEDGRPLRYVQNYLDSWRDAFALEPPRVNAVVGISRPAFPLNAADAIWQKYKLGERWKIVDPSTRAPATRNVFLDGGASSINALRDRGVVFWQCNVALGAVVQELAQATNAPAADVRKELIAGFVPGVRLMPSHVLAIGLAQEKGFTYMKP